MRNILVSLGVLGYVDNEKVKSLKEKASIDESYVIVGRDYEFNRFSKNSFCFYRDDCILGEYDKYINELEIDINPFDSATLTQIKPFMLDLLMLQRRFEDIGRFRVSCSAKDHYELLMRQLHFWNAFLDKRSIDTVLFSDIPHEGYDNTIFWLAKIKGLRIAIFRWLYPTEKYFVLEDYRDYPIPIHKCSDMPCEDIQLSETVNEFYNSLCSAECKQDLFVSETLRANAFAARIGLINPFLYIIQEFSDNRRKYKDKKETISTGVVDNTIILLGTLLQAVVHSSDYFYIVKKWFSMKRFVNQYKRIATTPNYNEKYVYFAMHAEPEVAIDPMGGRFNDQYQIIKMLSSSLPESYKLYVKIHPAQINMMLSIKDFYRYLMLGNVVLIREDSSQGELIANSFAVATATGEITIEALVVGIPTFVFGYSYYSLAPLSIKVNDREDIVRGIKDIEDGKYKLKEGAIKRYFKALDEATYMGFDGAVNEVIRRINSNNSDAKQS